MTWHASEPHEAIEAGGLLAQAYFPNGFGIDVVVVLNTPGPFTAILRIKRQGGVQESDTSPEAIPVARRIARSLLISSPGGYFQSPAIPQIHMGSGETLELVARDETVGELQGTLFTRQCG